MKKWGENKKMQEWWNIHIPMLEPLEKAKRDDGWIYMDEIFHSIQLWKRMLQLINGISARQIKKYTKNTLRSSLSFLHGRKQNHMTKRKEQIEEPKPDLEDPSPKSDKTRPGREKLMERMKRVDPKQSERYKQRTGEQYG